MLHHFDIFRVLDIVKNGFLFIAYRKVGDIVPQWFRNADNIVDDDLIIEPYGRRNSFYLMEIRIQ